MYTQRRYKDKKADRPAPIAKKYLTHETPHNNAIDSAIWTISLIRFKSMKKDAAALTMFSIAMTKTIFFPCIYNLFCFFLSASSACCFSVAEYSFSKVSDPLSYIINPSCQIHKIGIYGYAIPFSNYTLAIR
jgi:hypothetical protein